MYEKLSREDIPKLFMAFKKFMKAIGETESAKFESDDNIMDYIINMFSNEKCLIYVIKDDKSKVRAFMILFIMQTPFLNIKNRFWLEAYWKDKTFIFKSDDHRSFTRYTLEFIKNLGQQFNIGSIEGLVYNKRSSINKLYEAIGSFKRGDLMAFTM